MQKREETITVVFNEEGDFEFTIAGIKGSGCETIAGALDSVGARTGEERTSEYTARPDAREGAGTVRVGGPGRE